MKSVAVGSLNLLGDAYNALEFLESESHNPQFAENYKKIRAALMSLTSKEVLEESVALGFEAKTELENERFVDNCTPKFLSRDNKLSLAGRTNLIVGGMMPITKDDTTSPLFTLAKSWRKLMQAQRDSYHASGLDGPMMLWDIACSLAAEMALQEYTAIAEQSYLNPERLVGNTANLLEPLSGHEYVVLAAQEFPEAGSGKFNALREVMAQKSLTFVEVGDVGFIHSSSLQVEDHKESPLGTSASAVIDAINSKLSELPLLEIEADDVQRLETAFRKTIVLNVAQHLRFINVHVKELKTPNGTRFLARYLRALADDSRDNVVLSDTNIPNANLISFFEEGCKECGLQLLSRRGLITTRKQRSELHGQLPDKNKCLKVVEAQKDFILFFRGKGHWQSGPAASFPDLNADATILLPNSAWAADHSMVSVVLSPVQQ